MGEPLSLTVLGCDGSYPGPGGACSGYLLSCDGTHIWLDAGSGTMSNLQRHIAIEDIDAVVVSHHHPDHWSDLDHLAIACKWVISKPGIPVYTATSVYEMLRVGTAADVFEWHTMKDGQEVTVGPMTLSFSETDHVNTTLATRIDAGGRSIGYSADTGPGWDLTSLGSGLNLCLCEATFLQGNEGEIPHLSARQAGEKARDAGVERLVITHLWPRLDREAARAEASLAFGGDVTVASVGDRYVA